MNIDIFDKLRSFVERAIGSLSTMYIWLDDAKLILETVDKLRAEIARLNAERRWIPVSERLPKYGKPSLTIYHTKNATSQITIRCLVEDRDDKLRVIWYDIENGLWVNGNNITHWMPLPEPPEEK